MRKFTHTLLVLVISSITLFAQQSTEKEMVAKTLSDLETAIVENDSEAASSLLHNDVVILEGRSQETKDEYLSHHFHSDGKFLSAMNRETVSESIKIEGNVAWVSTITTMKGSYSGRDIDLTSLELAVLKKENGNWKIVALHWSSS